MKKTKRLIFWIFFAVLAVSTLTLLSACIPPESETTDPVTLLEYTLIDNGTEYSVSKGQLKYPFEIEIPSSYNGKPVTEIAANGFQLDPYDNVGSYASGSRFTDTRSFYGYITVPESVTRIGDGAFYGSIIHLTLHDNIKSIGKNAYPKKLTNSMFGYQDYDGLVIYIGNYVFGSEWDLVKKGDTVIREGTIGIADEAFGSIIDFRISTAIVLPEGLKWIGNGAFLDCVDLLKINFPDSIENIELDMFYGLHMWCQIVDTSDEMFYRYLNIIEEMYFGRTGIFTIEWTDGSSYVDDFRDYTLYIVTGTEDTDNKALVSFNGILHEFRHYYQFIAIDGYRTIYEAEDWDLDGIPILGPEDLLIKPTSEDDVEGWFRQYYNCIIHDIWEDYYSRSTEVDARDFTDKMNGETNAMQRIVSLTSIPLRI